MTVLPSENKLYGLVVCGGNSARMGQDKSMLVYYKKQQRYHLYEMLENVCDKVFISCNSSQVNRMSKDYKALVDLSCYENIGPMAALLTAFTQFPLNDFLIIGCDYPFISEKDVRKFLTSLKEKKMAAAFYNIEEKLYEPLLAWYSSEASKVLIQLFQEKQYSLQFFLKTINAEKYFPADEKIIKSVDNRESFNSTMALLKTKKYI